MLTHHLTPLPPKFSGPSRAKASPTAIPSSAVSDAILLGLIGETVTGDDRLEGTVEIESERTARSMGALAFGIGLVSKKLGLAVRPTNCLVGL